MDECDPICGLYVPVVATERMRGAKLSCGNRIEPEWIRLSEQRAYVDDPYWMNVEYVIYGSLQNGGQLVMRLVKVRIEEPVLEWVVHEHLMKWPVTLIQTVRCGETREEHVAEEYRISRQRKDEMEALRDSAKIVEMYLTHMGENMAEEARSAEEVMMGPSTREAIRENAAGDLETEEIRRILEAIKQADYPGTAQLSIGRHSWR